jgi:hypothetical protein
MLEEVRSWLVDEEVGLIGHEDVVTMADRAIEQLETPPDYLFALSLGQPLTHLVKLDLVKYPIIEADLVNLAARLLAGLKVDRISVEDVALVAARVSFPRSDNMSGVWIDFAWITDEMDLIEHGASDGSNFRNDTEVILRRISKNTG